MPWIVKNDKEFDWVGKWATQQVADRGLKWMLVGFESPTGAIPVEGGQVVIDGSLVGPGHERAAQRRARQGDRARDRPERARGRRWALRRPGRTGAPDADDRAPRAVLRSGRREGEVVSAASRSSPSTPPPTTAASTRSRSLGDRARAARPRRHVRGARRLARRRLDPRRGEPRRRRHRRRLAPDEARAASRGRADRGRRDRLVRDLPAPGARALRPALAAARFAHRSANASRST